MPNWCSNTLTVSGPPEEVEKWKGKIVEQTTRWSPQWEVEERKAHNSLDFIERIKSLHRSKMLRKRGYDNSPAKSRRWLFSSFDPIPKEVLEQGYSNCGHHWCISNWSTEWDVDDFVVLEKRPGLYVLDFSTAWSPPLKWLEKVARMYPLLAFRLEYSEEGMGYEGVTEYEDGKEC